MAGNPGDSDADMEEGERLDAELAKLTQELEDVYRELANYGVGESELETLLGEGDTAGAWAAPAAAGQWEGGARLPEAEGSDEEGGAVGGERPEELTPLAQLRFWAGQSEQMCMERIRANQAELAQLEETAAELSAHLQAVRRQKERRRQSATRAEDDLLAAIHDQSQRQEQLLRNIRSVLTRTLERVPNPAGYITIQELLDTLLTRLTSNRGDPDVPLTDDIYPGHVELLHTRAQIVEVSDGRIRMVDFGPDTDYTQLLADWMSAVSLTETAEHTSQGTEESA